MELGYVLSSEEHPPLDLVGYAKRAEETGFGYALISDHFHPWTSRQGQSPFVWSVIGAIAVETERLRLGTGVTCPTIRTHPAIIAHAAATTAAMMPGRFFLGVGSGERLNEHVVGEGWPPSDVRLEMLAEAILVMRLLWSGEQCDHHGQFYDVEDARLYTLPDEPPPLYVAASGPVAAELAASMGDGLISTAPDAEVLGTYRDAAGPDKPMYGQLHVCYAEDEAKARNIAHTHWPNTALQGRLNTELSTPEDYEAAVASVREDEVAGKVPCGPDPEKHLQAIRTYADAGYTHVYVHQIGPDQEGFFRFYEREVLPKL